MLWLDQFSRRRMIRPELVCRLRRDESIFEVVFTMLPQNMIHCKFANFSEIYVSPNVTLGIFLSECIRLASLRDLSELRE